MFGNTFVSSSGPPPPAPSGGGLTLISDTILVAPSIIILFFNIPQTYRHLKLIASLRSTDPGGRGMVQFNGDATASYNSLVAAFIAPAAWGTFEVINGPSGDIFQVAAPAEVANSFRVSEIIIADYASPIKNKSYTGTAHAPFAGTTGNIFNYVIGGTWNKIAPITSMVFFTGALGNFLIGSRVSLYGYG